VDAPVAQRDDLAHGLDVEHEEVVGMGVSHSATPRRPRVRPSPRLVNRRLLHPRWARTASPAAPTLGVWAKAILAAESEQFMTIWRG
jgi:hypothetical protein